MALPFEKYEDFMLADDSERGAIWSLDINPRMLRVCGDFIDPGLPG